MAARAIYCPRCSALVLSVEAEVRRQAVTLAVEGSQRIDALRKELMAKMLPPQLGGTGEGVPAWPQVGPRE